MGFLSRLFGERPSHHRYPSHRYARPGAPTGASADEQALARYRYLLRTAPPEAIEQAHAEAFAQLTPEQRVQVLRELGNELSPAERAAFGDRADPQALARMATRAEVRQPGTLERAFGGRRMGGMGMGMGMGMGGMLAGSLLSSIAGTFIGTAIAHQFLDGFDGDFGGDAGDVDAASADSWGGEGDSGIGDAGGDYGGDFGGDIEL
jgi:hypothetical protein